MLITMMVDKIILTVTVSLSALVFSTASGFEAPDPPPDIQPSTGEATEDQQQPEQDAPEEQEQPASLDELLGIAEENSEAPEDAARIEQDDDLDRALEESSMQDNFSVAIEKMEISANMLGDRHQSGLGTQRIQEDILRRLEFLMDQARQQQAMQSQSSQSARQNQPSPGDLSQPQQNQQQQGQNQNPSNENQQEGTPPPRQEGDINSNLEEEQREWGSLPERIREQLLQGRNEAFSRLYEKMTRSYYRLLAEEESP